MNLDLFLFNYVYKCFIIVELTKLLINIFKLLYVWNNISIIVIEYIRKIVGDLIWILKTMMSLRE